MPMKSCESNLSASSKTSTLQRSITAIFFSIKSSTRPGVAITTCTSGEKEAHNLAPQYSKSGVAAITFSKDPHNVILQVGTSRSHHDANVQVLGQLYAYLARLKGQFTCRHDNQCCCKRKRWPSLHVPIESFEGSRATHPECIVQ